MLRDAASSSGMRSVLIFDSTSPNLSYIGWRIFIRPLRSQKRRKRRGVPTGACLDVQELRCGNTSVR